MTKKKTKWQKWLRSIRQEAEFGPIQIFYDMDKRMHRDDGPAFISPTRTQWWNAGRPHGPFTDIYGSVCYYYHGVLIPKEYFVNPESLTFEEILRHTNTEVRRVGIEIFGLDRVMELGKAVILDEDERGQQLFHINIEVDDSDSSGLGSASLRDHALDPSSFVKVFNSTPEIDGTTKTYFLAVPPLMKTVKEAVAWTFYASEGEYHPQYES